MVIQIRDIATRDVVGLFKEFSSIIWTERYQERGDFELTAPLSKRSVGLFEDIRFIKIPSSSNMMMIKSIEYGENELKVTGYDLKNILYNRVIYEWRDTETKVKLKDFMTSLFQNSLTNSSYGGRNINNISLTFDIEDEIAETMILTDINRGDNLGEVFYQLCNEFGLGLDARFDVYSKNIDFIVYSGRDKRGLIFSRKNHNFRRSQFVRSYENFVSSMLVGGEGEGEKRKMVTVNRVLKIEGEDGTVVTNVYDGIKRVEGFIDAREIQKQTNESLDNYKGRLKNKAVTEMEEKNVSNLVDGEIRDTGSIKIGVDYDKGDVVTIKDDYFKTSARVTEIIRSWSSKGYEIYPTFKALDFTTPEITEEFNMS